VYRYSFVLWAVKGDFLLYGMADLISGRFSFELINMFNYTASSNISFVLFEISYLQTFQQHQNISILFFLSLLTNQIQTTTILLGRMHWHQRILKNVHYRLHFYS